MLIPRIRVRRLLPFCCLVTIALLSSIPLTARNSPGQEAPPQTEEQRQARVALNRGVQNFKDGRVEDAISYFDRAKQLDPQLLNARLYLATSYASLYIPGAPSEENQQNGKAAIAEFRGVLTLQPENLSAIDGIGSMLFQMAGTSGVDADMMQESKSFHQKHTQINPQDPEPFYWIGVIDWTLAFRANSLYRARYNLSVHGKQLSDEDPLPPEVRYEYAKEYEPIIEEGIENLQKAIALRPDYDDAMAYLSLMYRRKADIVETKAQREELEKVADDLLDKIKEIKQKKLGLQPEHP